MLKIIIALVFIISGCVVNPKYSDPKTISEEQAQKYPQNAEQIREQYRDYEKQQNIQNSQSSPKNSYTVTDEKISGWSVGSPDAVLHLGSNNYKYHHKINVTLVCDKNSFSPKPYSHKKLKWKVSDSIYGVTQTSLIGEANLYFNTETSDRFHKITMSTDQNDYDIGLDGYLILELKKNECN